MKNIEEIKETIRNRKRLLIQKHRIREIGIFGSFIRGEQEEKSDIDILVDFDEYPSMLEFMELEEELSNDLGYRVDLVMKSGLKPNIGKRILQEVVYI